MDRDTLYSRLAQIVGPEHVLTGADVSARATHFWDASPLTAAAIVRPADTAQTAAVLKLCHEAGQVVVTQGGATGLVKGHASTDNDLLLSMERMNDIEPVDFTGRTVTVGAGAILQNVQQAADDAGLQLGLDLGARGSCTIGGNISTNAGGLAVLRYGMTREQVLGLEVVLPDGTILSSLNRMMKNNAGYDLKQLFIGSEGTLGVITRAVLRLRPATPALATALLAFDRFEQVSATLGHLSHALNGTLDAFEVIWQPFYALNTDTEREGSSQSPLPRDYALYAIVESRGSESDATDDQFEQALGSALENELIVDAVIVQSERERQNIWHIREHIDIALQHDPVFVYDISLPIADMQPYVDSVLTQLQQRWPDVILYVYGHLADGNLHILVAPPAEQELEAEEKARWHEFSNQLIYQPLQSLGGSISAEHGIGLSKKPYLPLSRSAAEISLMQSLKRTLDPSGILNPGKIFD
ncbi:FAD-binding oxidoreductase [Granulosicoccus sp. 3-233]|uniref:FAD-binding oxidoreductase n=1 Tax=Granulosicoccus sp. 3-233 TaxID=3417969 RepID=UPI003D343BD5